MKKLLFNPKIRKGVIFALILGLFGSIVGPMIANASGKVAFESTLKVANVTAGDTTYQPSVNALVDDVVKVEVYYHNKEGENSGIQAKNVNVKIAVPTDTSKSHSFTSNVSGSNIDTFVRNATVNTQINTSLSYISGSAFRRHNIGTNEKPNWVTEKIADSVTTSGLNIPVMNPCFNFQETITILARVNAPVVSINKKVKVDGAAEFKTDIDAKPGDTLVYSIGFKNEGNVTLNDVVIRDSFPPGLSYIPGSAILINSLHPNGAPLSDKLIDSGVIVGNYNPGINGIVRFKAKVPANVSSGCHVYTNVGVVKSKELGEYYNTATVNVCVTPPPVEKKFKIKAIKFEDKNKNGKQDDGEERLSGWKFELGGNVNKTLITDSNGEVVFTDLSAGNYSVTETMQEGWENTTPITQNVNIPATGAQSEYIVCFGNVRKVTPPPEKKFKIKAIKFEDSNKNKVEDDGENRLSNWEMRLSGNGIDKTLQTNSNGEALFTDILPGNYTVTEKLQGGWQNTTPLSQSVNISKDSNQDIFVVCFGNVKIVKPQVNKYVVKAIKFEDTDKDGKQDENEVRLSGWTFRLKGNGVDESAITDSNGEAVFSDLEGGSYTLTETLQDGWVNVTPLTQAVIISKEAENGKEFIVCFGNVKKSVTPVTPSVTPQPEAPPVLPVSGPEQAAMGTLGSVSILGAIIKFRKSKKAIIDSLKQK